MAEYNAQEQEFRDGILGLCSALGGFEESIDDNNKIQQVYSVGDEALGCLKDLKRAIRLDSQNGQKLVLDILAEFNVVETDIVPMILSFKDNRNEVTDRFVLACVEILVPMTWPLEKNLDEEQQDDEYVDPNMMDSYRKYKSSLLTPGVFEIVLDIIVGPLRIPFRDRSVRDQTIIRLVLYFFRNLSAIPDIITSQSATIDQIRLSHLQEQFVIRLYKSDILELLLTIASNTTNEADAGEWNVLVLEILYNIIKHVSPKDVFFYKEMMNKNNVGDVNETTSGGSGRLGALLQQESANKRLKTGAVPSRHNRFGGTYVLKDWDGNYKVTHKQEGGFANVASLIDGDKKENRVGKRRKLRNELYVKKVYQDPISLKYIKTVAQIFLQSCFNAFFTSILKDIKREDKKILKNDIIRYYFTMKWFLEFIGYEQRAFQQVQAEKRQRSELLAKDRLVLPGDEIPPEEEEEDKPPYDFDLIAGVMDLGTVLYCLQMIRARLDDKKWFELQVTADCFKQMLVTLASMGKSQEEEYREVSEYIQSSLYYEQFTFDLIIDLIKCYNNQPYEYLKIVIMLVHQLLKLLEQFVETKKVIFVRKRKALQKKKKEREEQQGDLEEDEEDEEEEDRQNRMEYKEHEFSFKSFENKFITNKVVETYCVLLECYDELPSDYIHCITSMFHRIMVKRKVEYFFWKLPVMDLFNRILLERRSLPNTTAFRQLYEFIKYSVSRFFESANQYPLLYVEALFPTTKSDRSIWEDPDSNVIEDYIEDEEQRQKDGYNSDGGDSVDRLINEPRKNGHESDSGDSIDKLINSPSRGSKRKGYDSDNDSIDKLINGPKKDKGKGRATDVDPDLLETYFQAFDDLRRDNDDDPLF